MIQRIVVPEILDRLDSTDPEAIRSRRDLRLINALMGNERWIVRQVANFPVAARKGIFEIGAGEGKLLQKLDRFGPSTGLDIAPRPEAVASTVLWQQEDLFLTVERNARNRVSGGILVACLFLHHFDHSQLLKLSEFVRQFDVLCFVEPLRRPLSLACGSLILPLVNRVTRHDMPVSIRAGFDRGELQVSLGLTQKEWAINEVCSWRGGIRIIAERIQ